MRQFTFSLFPDFRTGRLVMRLGIGRILVLVWKDAIRNLSTQTERDRMITARIMMIDLCRRHDYLSAKGTKRVDLLLAHFVRHRKNALVALNRGGKRKPHPGVA